MSDIILKRSEIDIKYLRLISDICEFGEFNREYTELIGYIIKLDLSRGEIPIPTVKQKSFNFLKEKTENLIKLLNNFNIENKVDNSLSLKDDIGISIINIQDKRDLKTLNLSRDGITCVFREVNGELTCLLSQIECDLEYDFLQNLTFYVIATHIIAEKCGLQAKTINYNISLLKVKTDKLTYLEREIQNFIFEPPKINIKNGHILIENKYGNIPLK